MAQICGIQNHQRSKSSEDFTFKSPCQVSFVADGGVELMLHEFEPSDQSTLNPCSFVRKRGRPRKDSISNQSSFDVSPSKVKEERRLEKKMKKMMRLELKEKKRQEKEAHKKKRGRPRKLYNNIDDLNNETSGAALPSFNCSTNLESLTPPYSETDNVEEVGNEEDFAMMEILNLNTTEWQDPSTPIESIETKWTPIQRLTQINQALAFTTMYKDVIFWDRIVAEFTQQDLKFRLEFGTEKSFEIPFLVLSKFFWICSQLGLRRIQFLFTGLSEKLVEDDSYEDGVLFNSSEALIYSHMHKDQVLINHGTSQFIKFESNAKISDWTIHINSYEEFHKSDSNRDYEESIWGFPKKAIEFLDVALVMSTVLTDSVSWLTWFYTYIQQSGLKNFSIVELSRPPSPYIFPPFKAANPSEEVGSEEVGMEFFDKGRDFIFNVLSNANCEFLGTETPLIQAQSASEFEILSNPEVSNNNLQFLVAENPSEFPMFTSSIEPETEHEVNTNTVEMITEQEMCVQSQESEHVTEQLFYESVDLDVEISEKEGSTEEEVEDDFFDSYN